MSAQLAIAQPRRIKATHRRRRKVAAGHFVQRYYDPSVGRFLSVDPAASEFNLYSYASNNPYRFTDPDGRVSWDGFVEGVKNVVAPTGQELVKRGEPGTAGSNAVGAAKQVANTAINLVSLIIQTPMDRLSGGGLPNIPIANNQLEGAAAAEFVTSVALVAAPLARGTTAAELTPGSIAGKTPAQIDQVARQGGMIPKGPNPAAGRGSYVDPASGNQRILVHPDAGCGPHCHFNNAAGERLDINGKVVPPESPAAHLPLNYP